MIMDISAFCFAAVGICIIIVVIRQLRSEIAPALVAAAAIVMFAALIKTAMPLYDFVTELAKGYGMEGYLGIMIKALGIALCSRICSEICKDCGENAIAIKVELGGKIGILLLSIPLLQQIIKAISGLV